MMCLNHEVRDTMDHTAINFDRLISDRADAIDVSGIRRVFELGAKLKDPINLSIGQPDFPVPQQLKQGAIDAINNDRNGYTLTQGVPALRRTIADYLRDDVGWDLDNDHLSIMVTSGTSAALLIAFMAMLNPGDEAVIGDPYFVVYPVLGTLTGGNIMYCDTYPDFRMTAERVEPLLTERTKIVLVNSPGNPSGVVLTNDEMRDLVELCEQRGVMLISDEIYDEFTYAEARENGKCPSPARHSENMLLVRGYGKTYGCTGWRMGYAAGPTALLQQMMKLQQYTFVCAPSIAQHGCLRAFDVDMTEQVQAYSRKRDMVVEAMNEVTELVHPGGAFYAYVKVPKHLNLSATQFVEQAIEHNVLVIPGHVFSQRDTHFRISYAVPDDKLNRGLDILRNMMR